MYRLASRFCNRDLQITSHFHMTVHQLDKKYYIVHTNTSTHDSSLWVLKIMFLSSWGTVTWCCNIKPKDSMKTSAWSLIHYRSSFPTQALPADAGSKCWLCKLTCIQMGEKTKLHMQCRASMILCDSTNAGINNVHTPEQNKIKSLMLTSLSSIFRSRFQIYVNKYKKEDGYQHWND